MTDYRSEARRAAQRYGLDPDIFARQIKQESGFNPNARSPAGAIGIAQIMPATARGWGVDPTNPREALNAAAKNMARYVKQFGSYRDALVAYNAGPGAVGRGSLPAETQNYLKVILGNRNPGTSNIRTSSGSKSGSARGSAARVSTRDITQTIPGVDNSMARRQLVLNFLGNKNSDVLDFATQAKALADIPATTTTRTQRVVSGGGSSPTSGDISAAGGGDLASIAAKRASAIDQQRLPYSWGGGHQGKTPLHDAVPLDCSGAVSKVLGIDPRVSGEFGKWGRPGDGGNKGVTVYSNGHHVLMKINGHFFGTSGTNPGGGAGWIPQGAISSDYLKGFTARHSER